METVERTSAAVISGIRRTRRARIWMGKVGVASALLMVLAFTLTVLGGVQQWRGAATAVLLLAWIAMAAAYVVVKLGAALRTARLYLPDPIEPTPADEERQSFAWPLAAISLLAPLTLHFAVYLGEDVIDHWYRWQQGLSSIGPKLASFDLWIGLSAIFAGPAHVMLVVACFTFARDATGPIANRRYGLRDGFRATLGATAVTAILGVVAMLIPLVVVFFTGLVFLPYLFWRANRRIWRDRDDLQAATIQLRSVMRRADDDDSVVIALDPIASVELRRQHLRRIGLSGDFKRARGVVDYLLRDNSADLRREVFEMCRLLKHRPPPDMLLASAYDPDPSVAVLAIELLARHRSDLVQQKLISLLDPARPFVIQQAALRALGCMGDLNAVDALLVRRKKGGWPNRRFTGALDTAIASIQARCATGRSGQLSLLDEPEEDRAGALSPATAPTGALSLR